MTGRGTRPTVDNVSCFGGPPLETVGVSVTSDACTSSIITGKERPCSSCTTHVLPCGTSVMRGFAGVDLAPEDVVGTPPVVSILFAETSVRAVNNALFSELPVATC